MANNVLQLTNEQLAQAATTIRMLSADGVEKANSGHPGMPMGMAEIAAVLWLKHLNYNGSDLSWLNRDRFVLSNGHGSMLLYTMLCLTGSDMTLEDLKQFRQWESKTAGHPESFLSDGIECTTGPLGQGISNAVGMAIAQKMCAARYNTDSDKIFDHKVFVFTGDGCLMEGVSSEASSVAGHLGLDNLVVVYDDNHISIAGDTDLAFTEDVCARYEAYGWHTMKIDGHDFDQIDKALAQAKSITGKPVLIAARTTIGKGSPNKSNSSGVHGSPLGSDELAQTKRQAGWPEEMFYIPAEVKELFAARADELSSAYNDWQQTFSSWKKKNADLASQLEAQFSLAVPEDFYEQLRAAIGTQEKADATRKLSSVVLQKASELMNSFIGGSADLEPSTLTLVKDSTDVSRESFSGKNLRFGVREHGMAAIMNGLAYYGGFFPYGSTFLTFADYCRPSIRIAALSHLPGLYVFTHDSIFLGEDGPTHQPVEHLAALRVIPNLHVYRPADGAETAACYALALQRKDGPGLLALTRQGIPPLEKQAALEDVQRGAYLSYQSGDSPEIVFVATGSEVSLAMAAAKLLEDSVAVRVVSMPCWELYAEQDEAYKSSLIPESAKVVAVEAGSTFGWGGMLGRSSDDMLCIGIDRFGASAPDKVLAEKFGLTPESILERIKAKFS